MIYTTVSSPNRIAFKHNTLLKILLLLFLCCWLKTFLSTPNRANWFTENTLTILFLISLWVSHKKFKFSDLSYTMMTIYLLLHIYGAEYTYAENPFGYWLKDLLHTNRNYYDRIVHFSFGFLLTYPMRDYFKNHFDWPNWVCWTLPCEITLSFSAMYELIEWIGCRYIFPIRG